MIRNLFIYLLILVSILSGCKIKRQIVSSNVDAISSKVLINNISNNSLDVKSLSLKFSLDSKSEKQNISVGGSIRMQTDSLIWLSVSPGLGIEVARAKLTPDTLLMMNKLKAKYYAGNYSQLSTMFNLDVDYSIVQAILTGRAFVYPTSEENYSSYEFSIGDSAYCLSSIASKKLLKIQKKNFEGLDKKPTLHKIYIEPKTFFIKRIFINDYENDRKVDIKYSNFIVVSGHDIPKNIEISMMKASTETKILVEYNKAEINKLLRFPFKIPKRYKPMD